MNNFVHTGLSDKLVEAVSLEIPVEDPNAVHGMQYTRLVPIKDGSELILYGGANFYGKSEYLVKASSVVQTIKSRFEAYFVSYGLLGRHEMGKPKLHYGTK